MEVARDSAARAVMDVLRQYADRQNVLMTHIVVENAGEKDLNGKYNAKEASTIPKMFTAVCDQNGWPAKSTWKQLNGQGQWFKHEDDSNESYVYFNKSDKKWWIDGPDGLGR